jgi:hypothetical protein
MTVRDSFSANVLTIPMARRRRSLGGANQVALEGLSHVKCFKSRGECAVHVLMIRLPCQCSIAVPVKCKCLQYTPSKG